MISLKSSSSLILSSNSHCQLRALHPFDTLYNVPGYFIDHFEGAEVGSDVHKKRVSVCLDVD